MKIVIATGLYPPDIGGPATYTKFLERHLPPHGIDFSVVSFRDVRRYPRIIRHVFFFLTLLKEGRRADILYALDTVSVGLPTALASLLLRKRFYLRVPGDYAWEQGQQRFGIATTLDEYLKTKKKPCMVRILAWLQSLVARHASKIIVPSDYMRGVVGAWGVDPHKVTRIYSALSPIHVPETKEDLREKFAYSGFVVITAARLTPWKGIDVLIEEVVRLHNEGVDISLSIMGEGTERAHLESIIAKEGAQTYIQLFGMVDKQTLAKHVKASNVFVLNTSYEGLSHQLIEVMDIGTPIITTPVGGNVELIEHMENGLLVPFNDRNALSSALLRIHNDAALSHRLIACARERVQAFREETIIPEIIALLK